MKKILVKHDSLLLQYLIEDLKISRNIAKKLLSNYIKVNDKSISKFDYQLKSGDILTFDAKQKKCELEIIYEDADFICINKPAGLLSISTDKEKEKTAYHIIREYVKSLDKHNKIFILHRLDKDTSGVLLFCKKQKIRDELQSNWNSIVSKRGYYALCKGIFDHKSEHIVNHIAYNKYNLGYVTKDKKAYLCITDYKVLKQYDNYALVDIDIKTGRKNQIRISLSALDHPVIGDQIYGNNKAKRLYLHAYILAFKYHNKDFLFKTERPSCFKIVNGSF